ncbi:M56 family metallopeptidase [Spirosoma endophyticum]|uniref:Outer membrane transport energization protein TonB n=1 Tax=Spirosoma endophyticum TaxID=662367 RepID=A0A1I1VGQ4_9BACT|nr:M56 family metallopeptidase [Spirosoma endophyticum]SFD82197.1 outer membrane transport energization protein TonB [Spirosoma endophyticum]
MNALPYFLTASLYLLLFYGCYVLLLRRNTFFSLNRAYLLMSIGLSITLPFIELPSGTAESLPVGTITLPAFAVKSERATWSQDQWFWLIYGLGVVVMSLRLGLNLRAIFRLIKRGTAERKSAYTLVRLPKDLNLTPSFSFGQYLVLNHADALTEPDVLLRHEEAHIRQHHTSDVLFLEIVQVAFWFNPVLWLYKRALQEVHEFLADRAVLKTPQPDYPRQLVAYALNVSTTALITPFVSKSTLKQRIVMLHKPQTHRRALLGYVLVLPLAALLTMCSQSERDQPQSEASAQTSVRKPVKVDGEVYTVVENQPEFPGGMEGLGAFMQKNLKYPEAAQKAEVEGRVFVRFIVTKEGDITDVQILKGIGYGADAEAVRVVKSMPRWKPAKQGGQAVNVQYNLPINFQLEEDKVAEKAALYKGIKHFIIDGKEVTEGDITALSPDKIARMDVNKEKAEIIITTK